MRITLKKAEKIGPDSYRDWMFNQAGERNPNNEKYQFWQQSNHPIELNYNSIMDQKLDYLHDNPVVAGWVRDAEDYLYSSAIDYSGGKGLISIRFID